MIREFQATMHSQGFEQVGEDDISSENKKAPVAVYGKQVDYSDEHTVDKITSVRYHPDFKYYDEDSKEFEYPEIFYGRFVAKKPSVRLTSEWVLEISLTSLLQYTNQG